MHTHLHPCTCFLCGRQKARSACEQNRVLKQLICDRCTKVHDYTDKNTRRVGRSSAIPPFSLEFEVAAPTYTLRSRLDRALVLVKYGFLRTYDGSVDDEYKSPIYQSLRAFYRPLGILHTLRDLVTVLCGTHLHVTMLHKTRLHAIHEDVFDLLLTHIEQHCSETSEFWGREPNRYAQLRNGTRFSCFNTHTIHDTLEFRLPRFRSAEQYLSVVRFCLHLTSYLDSCLDPDRENSAAVTPGLMAQRVLSLYQDAVAHPLSFSSLPVLTKGAHAYV